MSSKSWKCLLKNLKSQCDQVLRECDSVFSKQDFSSNPRVIETCSLQLQILIETASKVPAAIRKEFSSLPWKELRELKKRLGSARAATNSSVAWDAIQKSLPKLQTDLAKILERLDSPSHPWRICPPGETYVRKTKISPYLTKGFPVVAHIRRDHCRVTDDSAKNTLTLSEAQDIAEIFFRALSGPPSSNNLGTKRNETKFDHLIRGWTKYWNDIFQPDPPLDPDKVKALIASESGFVADEGKGQRRKAKGLMQLLPLTLKALQGYRNELKEHLFEFDEAEIYDPSLHIAAGIRWLFQERIKASRRLKRQATWDEAVENYKDYLRRRPKKSPNIPHEEMDNYFNFLKALKESTGGKK